MPLKALTKQKKVDEFNFPYTLNPYIGCVYRCIYCYAKGDFWKMVHGKRGYTDLNKAKPNHRYTSNNLHYDLQHIKPSGKWIKEVQIGNNYDPYPPIEKQHKITRGCLDVFTKYPDWKVHLETKSDLILRDINVLQQLNDFEAEITITTLNHDKYFEPRAPSTQRRFEVMEKLADNGLFVRVMIMPVLGLYIHRPDKINRIPKPYTEINEIIQQSYEHGAQDFKIKDMNYFTIGQLVKQYNIPPA